MDEVAIQDVKQVIHSNATITASGSQVVLGYGSQQVSVVVNVKAAPTGTTPTIKFTIQEVDPGDQTTTFGNSASTLSITTTGVYTATVNTTTSGTLLVSWTVTGTTPSFTQVYSTVVTKVTPTSQAVSASPSNSQTGSRGGYLTLGGGSSGSLNAVRATTYTEQTTNAQRSISSSNNTADLSAGTGARTVTIVYLDQTGAGPFTETVTLNGTTPQNTVNTNICFIEYMLVATVGTGGANVGTITLFSATGGGGVAIGSIGVGNLVTGVGDNRTLWSHHYTPNNKTLSLTSFIVGASATTTYFLRAKDPTSANSPEEVVFGSIIVATAEFARAYGSPPALAGPARITAYAIPSTNGVTVNAAFDFYET